MQYIGANWQNSIKSQTSQETQAPRMRQKSYRGSRRRIDQRTIWRKCWQKLQHNIRNTEKCSSMLLKIILNWLYLVSEDTNRKSQFQTRNAWENNTARFTATMDASRTLKWCAYNIQIDQLLNLLRSWCSTTNARTGLLIMAAGPVEQAEESERSDFNAAEGDCKTWNGLVSN